MQIFNIILQQGIILHQIVPEGTHRVLFCSWSIVVSICAHINLRLAPAWIISEMKINGCLNDFHKKLWKEWFLFSQKVIWNGFHLGDVELGSFIGNSLQISKNYQKLTKALVAPRILGARSFPHSLLKKGARSNLRSFQNKRNALIPRSSAKERPFLSPLLFLS